MKNTFVRLLTLVLFMVFYLSSSAQTKDSLNNNKKIKDSILLVTAPGYYVPDSLHSEKAVRTLKSGRKIQRQDSVFLIQEKVMDSTHKKAVFTANANYSNYTKARIDKTRADSSYKTKALMSKRLDTLQRLTKGSRVKYDSLRKLYALNVKLDTFHKYKLYQSVKLDSIKRKIYLQNIKADSQRIKEYLRDKKIRRRDTVVIKEGFGSKNLSMEITCNPGDTVYIHNNYRNVIIKNIPSQKLRLSTTFYFKEVTNERSPEIFKKMGIELQRTNTSVTAMIKGTNQANGRTTNEPCPDDKLMESNSKRSLVIELPGNAIIVVNTKFAETNIENFVTWLKAEITNGSLRMGNADYAVIKSNYGDIRADEFKNADLNLSSTSFTASNIVALSVVSNSSKLYLKHCVSMNMASTNDEYKIDEAGSITGNKDFGKMIIDNLKAQLVLTGASAHIKIDNLSYEAPLIKINNKYADLKLSLANQMNYAVNYEGSYKDISKLSTTTQKLNGLGNITARLSVASDTLASMGSQAKVNTKFKAVAGNVTGKHTKIDIVCPYCNVVFN